MPCRVLSKQDEQFIRENYLKLSSRKIGTRLGHPRGTITSFLKRERLSIPADLKIKWRLEAVQEMYDSKVHPEDELIKELYLEFPEKTLAELVGRSDTFVRGRIKKLNLVIPAYLIEQRKIESRLKPGNVPINKGKKQTEYMTKDAIERTKATRFKKGGLPGNTLFDGALSIRWRNARHSNGRQEEPHWYIRLAKGVWQELQIFEWERLNGPVPPKHVLACQDGDTLNIDPSNWKPIPMADNMRRNSASLNLTDTYVAFTLAGKTKTHLIDEFKKSPELIEAKRSLIQLQRTLKNVKNGEQQSAKQ
jgi:hypothetical protein